MASSLLERKTVDKWTFQVRPSNQKNVEQEKKKEKRRKKRRRKILKMMKSEYLEWAGGPSFRPRRR